MPVAGIPLAQAIGRPADYFSQELFGAPTNLPWAVEIPSALRPGAYADAATFHPAFLYEALWSLATVGILLEQLRTDTTFRLLGLSRNGWIAAAPVLSASTALIVTRRQGGLVGVPDRVDAGHAELVPVRRR